MNFEKFFDLMRESRCGLCIEKDKGCKGFDIAGQCKDFHMPPKNYNRTYKTCVICSNYFNCKEKDTDSLTCTNFQKYTPRCDKCVYIYGRCGYHDTHGECINYKRDPPDGGYYG